MGYPYIAIGSTPIIDLRSDTVTADTLLSGITAHDAQGNPVVGNRTFADIESETGIYAPDADTLGRDAVIQFARPHDSPPILFLLYDTTSGPPTGDTTEYSIYQCAFCYSPVGWPYNNSNTGFAYGFGREVYRMTSAVLNASHSINYPFGDGVDDNVYHADYWGSAVEFYPGKTGGDKYYFRAGKQYRWYAVFPA